MTRTFYGPEFLKVFVPECSSKHLRIPPAYVKKFIQKLEGNVVLKDTNGSFWDVDMVIIEKHLCFGTGWEDFVRDHCLANGDSLLFKRLGNCVFGVQIYDKNGCKKKVEAIPKMLEGIKVNEEDDLSTHAYRATQDERRGINGSKENLETARNKPSGFDRECSSDRITRLKATKDRMAKGSSNVGARSATVLSETPSAIMRKQMQRMSPEEMLARVTRKKFATPASKGKSTMEEIPLKNRVQATTISRMSPSPSPPPSSQSSPLQSKKKRRLEGGGVDLELPVTLSLQDDFNAAFQVGSSLLTRADEEILLSKPIKAVAERFAAHSAWAMQEGLALGCFYVQLQALYETLELEHDTLRTQLEVQKSNSKKKERWLRSLLGEANQLHMLELEKNERLTKKVTELQEEAKYNYSLGWMKARYELVQEHMEGKHASWEAAASEVAHYKALLIETEEFEVNSHQEGP